MKSKQEWSDLWDKAPINKFINYSALDVEELRKDGRNVTDDWARALYLLEQYSGGGYLTSIIKASRFWRFAKLRFFVPHAEAIAPILHQEQLYTFCGNRDVPTLLGTVAQRLEGKHIEPKGELAMIFQVIEEKTTVPFGQKSTPIASDHSDDGTSLYQQFSSV